MSLVSDNLEAKLDTGNLGITILSRISIISAFSKSVSGIDTVVAPMSAITDEEEEPERIETDGLCGHFLKRGISKTINVAPHPILPTRISSDLTVIESPVLN